MRAANVLVLSVAVLGAAHAGCGSGGAVSDGGTQTTTGTPTCDAGGCTPLTPGDEAFLDDYCKAIEACCVLNAVRTAPDIAGCKTQLANQGFSHDPGVQSACLAVLHDRAATGMTCFPSAGDLSGPCVRLFFEPGGALPPGQRCTLRAQCAGAPNTITLCADLCIQMASGKPGDGPCLGIAYGGGVINAIPLAQPGTTDRISTGFICDRGAGVYCAYSQDPAQQKCQALGGAGASCANSSMAMSCASAACDDAATCEAIVPAGQPCGSDVHASCDTASSCDFSVAPAVCVARLPSGSACAGDSQCTTNSCTTDGHCAVNSFVDVFGFCGRNVF